MGFKDANILKSPPFGEELVGSSHVSAFSFR